MTEFDAEFDAGTAYRIKVNEDNWNARTPVHEASAFYGIDGSRPWSYWFEDHEWDDIGDVDGLDVLHLMCHLGTETVAFAEQGARTVGLDISPRSLEAARRVANGAGVDIDFVRANVYDARSALGDRTFDVIYTGKGALCYLPDLDRWASIVRDLLRPGGRFSLVEFHPLLNALGVVAPKDGDQELTIRNDYLRGRGPIQRDSTYTYTDGPRIRGETRSFEWMHGIGEVVTALSTAGLRIERVRETEEIPWQRWTAMVPTDQGWWRLPPEKPRIPLFYAVLATAR